METFTKLLCSVAMPELPHPEGDQILSATERQERRDCAQNRLLTALTLYPTMAYDALLSKLLMSERLLSKPDLIVDSPVVSKARARWQTEQSLAKELRHGVRCPLVHACVDSLFLAQKRTGVFKFYDTQKRFSTNGLTLAQRQRLAQLDEKSPAVPMTVSLPSIACFLMEDAPLNEYLLRRVCCLEDPLQEYFAIAAGLAMARDYGRNLRQRFNVASRLGQPLTMKDAKKMSRTAIENRMWDLSNDACVTFAVPAEMFALMTEVRIKATIVYDFLVDVWSSEKMSLGQRQEWLHTLYPMATENTSAEQNPGPRVDTIALISNCTKECRLSLSTIDTKTLVRVVFSEYCRASAAQRSYAFNTLVSLPL